MPPDLDTTIPSAPPASGANRAKPREPLLARGCAWFTLPWLVAGLLFVSKLYLPIFEDPDFYWHLKAGEFIAQAGAVPTTDPFSWTFPGKAWFAHEWLSELIFHAALNAGGFLAISLLVATVSVATFWRIYRLASRLSGSEIKGTLIATICAVLLLPFLVPRPQLFTFFFFAVYLDILLGTQAGESTKRLWLLPCVMLSWVNLHGAFMVGLALLSAFATFEWIELRASENPDPVARRNLRRLALAIALTVLATLFNPQGFKVWLFPFELMSMEASKGGIAEWRSPDFHDKVGKMYLLGICAFLACLAYTKKRPRLSEIALAASLLAAGLTSVRHLPLMALMMSALSAIYLRSV